MKRKTKQIRIGLFWHHCAQIISDKYGKTISALADEAFELLIQDYLDNGFVGDNATKDVLKRLVAQNKDFDPQQTH